MKQVGFYDDLSSCIGCRTCEIACKDKNNLEVGPRLRRVVEVDGGNAPTLWSYKVSMSCFHCEDPACVKVCPTDALVKREKDGIVIPFPDKCIGCRRCEWACPYRAPQYDAVRKKVVKCNYCYDLVDQGLNPACVDACLMRVLKAGPLEDLKKEPGVVTKIRDLANPRFTRPSVVFKPHRTSLEEEPGQEIPSPLRGKGQGGVGGPDP